MSNKSSESGDDGSPTSSLAPSNELYQRSQEIDDNPSSISSRSSAGVQSVSLEQQNRAQVEFNFAHNHILPDGWICHYDPGADKYEFEFRGTNSLLSDDARYKESDDAYMPSSPTRDGAISAKTPTTDFIAQTSRRPTLYRYECKYGYHFPTSPTPSMISDLAKQVKSGSPAKQQQPKSQEQETATRPKQIGYGKSMLIIPSDEEIQKKRLNEMFPTATMPVIEQMIRIYHGREGLIKAALISLGYKRASEYDARQAAAQSPMMLMMSKPSSKKLFEKLVGYFPDQDETLIKTLMYKHKEVEHKIISILVESSQSGREDGGIDYTDLKSGSSGFDKNGSIMKLRYLKYLFPTCDEIELYHLLYRNDLDVQRVIVEVEKKGHRKANIDEILKERKSQAQVTKAKKIASKEKAPDFDSIEAHKKRAKPVMAEARANKLKDNLSEKFGHISEALLFKALEAADYNETLATKFLMEMKQATDEEYKRRYEIFRDKGPDVVLYPCKGVQKDGSSFMSITSTDNLAIAREIVECDHALALLKVDASTFTQDDFESKKFTHARGRDHDLARGSIYDEVQASRKGMKSIYNGKRSDLRHGSNYKSLCQDHSNLKHKATTTGRNRSLTNGRNINLRRGHNSDLIVRVHPFFKDIPTRSMDVR